MLDGFGWRTDAKVVACLGRIAWQQMAGRKCAFDPAGGCLLRVNGWLLYPMYHPAYVNRGAYPVTRYARHFARLVRLAISQTIG